MAAKRKPTKLAKAAARAAALGRAPATRDPLPPRDSPYAAARAAIMEALEGIPAVKAPAAEYFDALEAIGAEVEEWFTASYNAAREDLIRESAEASKGKRGKP